MSRCSASIRPVRASQRARGESVSLVDDLVAADEARRNAIAQFEELRAEQKALGKRVAQADGADRAALLSRTKELADMVKKAEAAQNGSASPSTRCCVRSGTWCSKTFRPAARTITRWWRPSVRPGLRRRGLPSQRSSGARPVARRNRRGTRRQGLRVPLLLPDRAGRGA